MKAWILILTVYSTGYNKGGVALAIQEFDTKAACMFAAKAAQGQFNVNVGELVANVRALCVPKG
jgi:hypothetical protein